MVSLLRKANPSRYHYILNLENGVALLGCHDEGIPHAIGPYGERNSDDAVSV